MPKSTLTPADVAAITAAKTATENAAENTEKPQAEEDTAKPSEDTKEFWKAEAEKWKSFSRKHEDRVKTLAAKAKAYDEYQDSQKTEMEKLQEAAAKAEARAKKLEVEALRASIGAKHGVDPALLTGTSEEEITAAAQTALEWGKRHFNTSPKPAATSANVAGEQGEAIQGERQLTREDLKTMTPKQISEAREKGQLNTLLGVKS